MDSGLYAACAGLMARTDSLDAIANNLANTSTAGYRARQGSFSSVLAESGRQPLGSVLNQVTNNYGVLGSTHMDQIQGSMNTTGNPMDFAVQGPGYFAVQTHGGVQYTRNGSFKVSPQGQLTTQTGEAVLGENGVVQLLPGTVSVSTDGTISSNGAVAGRLKLVEFAPGTELQAAGNNFYTAPATSVVPAANSTVQQGMLENSNVNPIASVVQLIDAQRSAETMRHALSMFDSEMNKTAAEDLPRVTS